MKFGVMGAAAAAVLLIGCPAGGQGTAALSSLSPEQREAFNRGKPVQLLTPVASSPWPRSTVFQLIDATPEECAAVLSDYALQSTYVPRLRSSRVIARRGRESDVEYVIDIPLFADERSISRQRIHDRGGYSIAWHTVIVDSQASNSITSGSATFTAVAMGSPEHIATLMVHD